MELKYFSLNDDKDTLKKKYKQLAFQHHPDKNPNDVSGATSRMQIISEEFQYCVKNGGAFKDDISSGADLGSLIAELFNSMLDELIEQEKNQTVIDFLKNMKVMFKKSPSGINDFLRVLWNVGNHMKNNAYKHPYEKIKKKKNPYTR